MNAQQTMNTQQIADRLVELCRQGQFQQAQEELYLESAISIEPESVPNREARGRDAIVQKGQQLRDMIQEFHGSAVSDPIVAGNYFSISLSLDVTWKDGKQNKIEEIAVYQVRDGKVVEEQFFY